MFSSTTLFIALTAISSSTALAGTALQTLDNIHATVYYDLTNSLCSDSSKGDPFTNNWAETSGINEGIPFCEGQTSKTLKDLGTNRIVAMNNIMVTGDPSKWCGKEVQITQSDGTVFTFDEGPLFIWDACAACSNNEIIDLSAKAFTQLKGGSCAGTNPTGLKVEVLDNNIWEAGSGGSGSGGGQSATTSESDGQTTSTTTGAEQSATQVISTSIASSSSSSSSSSSTNTETSSSGDAAATTTIGTTPSSLATHTGTRGSKEATVANDLVNTATTLSFSVSQSEATALATSQSSPAPTTSSLTQGGRSACIFGAWQCIGQELQVCNYVSTTQLGWETIETCGSKCEVTASGSIDCE